MLSYTVHTIIFLSYVFVIVTVVGLILLKLPFPQFVSLLETIFGFTHEGSIENSSVAIDLCGDKFDLQKKLSNRLPFILGVGAAILISIVLFVDGCVFSTRRIYNTKECVTRTPNCYIFQSNVSKFQPVYEFVCESDQPVIPSNMSHGFALCYGFVIFEQASIDVIYQMGLCQTVLWLIEYYFPPLYRISHYKRGYICISLLLLICVVVECILIAGEWNVSLLTMILLASFIVLLGKILFLRYRLVKTTYNLFRRQEYHDLENMS